jgi:hypothetical protein
MLITEPKVEVYAYREDDGDSGYGVAPEAKRILWSYKNGDEEVISFERELALAELLLAGVVFLNNHWWEDNWPEKAKDTISMNIVCNDVFAWGTADLEEASYRDICSIWGHWKIDPIWGTAVWCMKKKKLMPQKPVEKLIREAGIWDLDAMELDENKYE